MPITQESIAPEAQKVLASSRRAAAETWGRLATQGSELREEAASMSDRLAHRARDYVEDQPIRALWLGVAAGAVAVALVGLFTRDRYWHWH